MQLGSVKYLHNIAQEIERQLSIINVHRITNYNTIFIIVKLFPGFIYKNMKIHHYKL